MKVEVAVLDSRPYGVCGRNRGQELCESGGGRNRGTGCTSGRVYVLPLMLMYLVFSVTRMPGEPSYRRRLRSLLLYLCYVFRALIKSLVC